MTHTFTTELVWTGSTAGGPRAFPRAHEVSMPPAAGSWRVSAAPAFHGDADAVNPEQLLVAAASSCHLMSFLWVAARAGVEVLGYTDSATGEMDDRRFRRLDRVVLRPRVTVATGTSVERVVALFEEAHRECFVANSLVAEFTLLPEVVVAPGTVGGAL